MQKKDISIVIGVVGFKAAGKDTFCEYLVSKYDFLMERTSDYVKEEAKKRGIKMPTTKDLQDVGDALRRESGDGGCWMRRMIDHAAKSNAPRVLLNGIRNPVEIETLKEILGDRLVLIGIVATTVVRAKRFMERAPTNAPTLDYFLLMDDRDRGINQPSYGQQVDRALALVPFENVFVNNGTLDGLHEWADTLVASSM